MISLFSMPKASAITWDPIEEISEDKRIEYQRYPAIAADSGKAYAIWTDNGDRDYDVLLREHDGAAWQLEEELNTDDKDIDQRLPDVAVDGSTVHAVWQDPTDGDWDIMYRSRSGGVLGPVQEISVDTGFEVQQYPRVATYGGNVYVVWQDARDGDFDIYYRYHDGISWSAVQEISVDSGTEAQTFPCVAAGGSRVYVIWVDAGGGDTDIVMRVFNGVSWGSITEVSQDSANEDQDEPDVSYDSGKVHVVWQEVQGTDRDIFHRSWDGTSFSSIQEISIDSGTEFQDLPSVAAEFGKVHVVWADRGDGDWDIVYRQYDGISWTAIQEISGDLASENQWNPYVASDNGVVHVVWEDQGDGDQDIFYRRGSEAPPTDNTPPDVLNVLLDGMPAQTYLLSTLPASISLTATVDDSARGNSVIGGANFTIGPGDWATSTLMMPDDFLDSSNEGFHYDVTPLTTTGTWQYCVYGWDIVPNGNTIGSCATLTIIDDLAPLVISVLIDGLVVRNIAVGTPTVTLFATVDDSSTGGSTIAGANYTSPSQSWMNSTPMIPDDSLDTALEGFHATVDTSSLGLGTYDLCAYGWDESLNYNTSGSCATLIVNPPGAIDLLPPEVLNVSIGGSSLQTYYLSSLPPTFALTAVVDDSLTGGSLVLSANSTIGPGSWPGAPMNSTDGTWDEVVEDVEATLSTPSQPGSYVYCVYGSDQEGNHNTTGDCATLDVVDDLPPEVSEVLLDGEAVRTISAATSSVILTAAVNDLPAGGSTIGGANFTSPSLSWGNSTMMTPSMPPFDSPYEAFEFAIDTLTLPEGTFEVWVYGWDALCNLNITPSVHAILNVIPVMVVDNPPDVEIVTIHPPSVEEGETVEVVVDATDDGTVIEVRLEVTSAGGLVVDNISADYDDARGGYVVDLSYDQAGVYTITAWARDDGGNWANQDGIFEVLEFPPAEQANYKPVLALLFTVLLILLGLLVIKKAGVDDRIRRYWFLPFAVAEALTGAVSAATGVLGIPPVAGTGLVVDLVILAMGLSVPLLLLIRQLSPAVEDAEDERNESKDDTIPENAK
jgi:hypothetical protein